MNKRERFAIFLEQLMAAPPATSRPEALELVKNTMNQVEDMHSGLPWSNFTERMHVYGFDPLYSWRDLDQDPCYWDDSVAKTHRIYLFHDGRIQIYRLPIANATATAILDKPGI
jgi:hypothetical protein